ncbi:MAG: AzlC family ABC transporter permease [Phreatobacter sp.]|uniref:AzlC family ABC transporter permease n=1 Tax=Phreatobacter sp. TaxID=1966341 RepID=UPI001A40BDD4|nr:AzlC family ABC transporter permease [Phreatobacter sp.]MBL8571623.1 AzlC family ABC transporter permease [Phreatobacter sp.]
MTTPNPPYVPLSQAAWYRRGLRASAALPAVILAATFIGIGSVCADYGMPLVWALLATLLIWAGPAHLILVGGLGSGASWVAIALTVGLSSVRLLPMVVSLLPYLRLKDRNPLVAALCAHMVAISIWVEGLRLLPQVDAEGRVPFFLGLGTGLLASAAGSTVIGYGLAGIIPNAFAAGLLFLTPIFFLLSLFTTARMLSDRLAIGIGFFGLLLASLAGDGLELLYAGLGGGTLAYALGRIRRARAMS